MTPTRDISSIHGSCQPNRVVSVGTPCVCGWGAHGSCKSQRSHGVSLLGVACSRLKSSCTGSAAEARRRLLFTATRFSSATEWPKAFTSARVRLPDASRQPHEHQQKYEPAVRVLWSNVCARCDVWARGLHVWRGSMCIQQQACNKCPTVASTSLRRSLARKRFDRHGAQLQGVNNYNIKSPYGSAQSFTPKAAHRVGRAVPTRGLSKPKKWSR